MTFEELNLKHELMRAVKELGFVKPTPIQKRCIPEIKAGKDVVGQSLTGSGKTAAFGLPMLEKISHGAGVQALILTPTRELCVQIEKTMREFSKFMKANIAAVFGGVGIEPQIEAIFRADIVVGTPGRILDHINRNVLKLGNIRILVVDEADKMFEMGFIEDVEKIISYTPRQRQTLLFSATISQQVYGLVRKHLHNPVIIKEQIRVDRSLLKQVFYSVRQQEKFSLLVHLLKHKTPGLAIVFCATRREVDIVARNLKMNGVHAMAVHGGLSQNKRLYAVDSLKNEDIQVLVATDVAARGLDIQNISHIYNYDVPKTSDEYVHRIGRTARAGKSGEAVTLLTERDHDNFRNVEEDRTLQIRREELPEFQRVRFVREEQRRGSMHSHQFHRRQRQHSHAPRFGSAGSGHGSHRRY
jgi:ATP-dependent RNA helicase DeaD